MKPTFLPYLFCPSCRKNQWELSTAFWIPASAGMTKKKAGRTPIEGNEQRAGNGEQACADKKQVEKEIESGALRCRVCHQEYPIRRGIPRILVRRWEESERVGSRFAFEWRKHARLYSYYERQFLDWIAPLGRNDFKDKVILDAGCGKGRHLTLAHRFGSKTLVGADIGEAVDIAYRHTRFLPNVHVLQADLLQLPFSPQTFDVVYSIGVIHHLPHPREGVEALWPLVKPGGILVLWVYAREGNEWLLKTIDPLRRYALSILPIPVSYLLAFPLALLLSITPVREVLRAWIASEYLRSIESFPVAELHHIVFDQLQPVFSHYLPKKEVAGWFGEKILNRSAIRHHHQNSWLCLMEKAQAS